MNGGGEGEGRGGKGRGCVCGWCWALEWVRVVLLLYYNGVFFVRVYV